MMVGLYLLADNFVLWFYGAEYEKVGLLLKISCPLLLLMCVGNFVGVQFLSPTGNQRKMTYAYLTAVLINFALNLILIPRLLSVGALLASVVAEFVSCSIQIYYLKKSEFNFSMFQDVWKYITASLIMGLTIVAFRNIVPFEGMQSTFFDVALGAMVYFAFLVLIREKIVTKLVASLRAIVKV